jgi:hypothetical protein
MRRDTGWSTMTPSATLRWSATVICIVSGIANMKTCLGLELKLACLLGDKITVDNIKIERHALGCHGRDKWIIVNAEACQKISHNFIVT